MTGSAWDLDVDVAVAGAGPGGLATALRAHELGASVAVLEKGPRCGGTALKAAAWFWVPNNRFMRAAGIADPRDEALRYLARIAHPELYNPDRPSLGLDPREHELLAAFYDHAAAAVEGLEAMGALRACHEPGVPNYFSHLAEDAAAVGRVLIPADEAGEPGNGVDLMRGLQAAAEARSIPIELEHRVVRALVDEAGRVAGVEAKTPAGRVRVRARRAVVFASGGFTHNPALRRDLLAVPTFGGCAAATNEGDFLAIAQGLGAALSNLSHAWLAPLQLERALAGDPDLVGVCNVPGDSMLFVNRHGRRTINEKAPYNELVHAMCEWDGRESEYPNLLMFPVWDQRSADHFGGSDYGRFIPEPAGDWSWVIRGETLADLAEGLRERLAAISESALAVRLSEDFETELSASIERFNGFAEAGKDDDLGRGETPIELAFHGEPGPGASAVNPTMHPISTAGPYYATILAPGTLDTKGGPKANVDGQILDVAGAPIPGLYGVGNCVASPSARAYWAAGATIGPILTYAWLAGAHASRAGAPLTR